MDLILWRHAQAEEGDNDLARALTCKGEQQARAMAGWLAQHLPACHEVVASGAKRSQQTAAFLRQDFRIEPAIDPGASTDDVLDVLAATHAQADTIVCGGHQPWLGGLAARLLSGEQQYWHVKKAAIWWLRLDSSVFGQSAVLRAVLSPSLVGA